MGLQFVRVTLNGRYRLTTKSGYLQQAGGMACHATVTATYCPMAGTVAGFLEPSA